MLYRGESGDLIRGEARFAEGPAPRDAIVVVHGFKGFKDWAFFSWTAEQLARRGHAVITFDFSCNGIGDSPEEFTELEAFARNTHSRELLEIDQIVELVCTTDLLPRRPDRIGLLGHSRGGGAAVVHAAGVGLLEDFERNRERLDVTAAAGRVRVPWLILHGEDDTMVRFDDAERLAAASGNARLISVPAAGHTFEACHPFEVVPEPLRTAFDRTAAHFATHMGD